MERERYSKPALLVTCLGLIAHSTYGISHWTKWSRFGSCSVTCGAGEIWLHRTCVGDSPNPVCAGAQQRTIRCQKLACPENEEREEVVEENEITVTNKIKNEEQGSKLNIPAVAGITACVIIILFASCFILYRKMYNLGRSENKDESEDQTDDNCAASTSSTVKHGIEPYEEQREKKPSFAIAHNKFINCQAGFAVEADQHKPLLPQNSLVSTKIPDAVLNINHTAFYSNRPIAASHFAYNTTLQENSQRALPFQIPAMNQPNSQQLRVVANLNEKAI